MVRFLAREGHQWLSVSDISVSHVQSGTRKHTVKYLFCLLSHAYACAHGSLGHLKLVFLNCLCMSVWVASPPCIHQTLCQQKQWLLLFRDKLALVGTRHDLSEPTKIYQHPHDTFLASMGGPNSHTIPEVWFGSLRLLQIMTSPWIANLVVLIRAGEDLFPGWKHPSHLQRSSLVPNKWIPNPPWIGHS